MAFIDYYAVLEVHPTARAEVIQKAYRVLVTIHHPDKNPGDAGAASRVADLNAAYEVLRDNAKRGAYDVALAASGRYASETLGRKASAGPTSRETDGTADIRDEIPRPTPPAGDEAVFALYRKASRIYQSALNAIEKNTLLSGGTDHWMHNPKTVGEIHSILHRAAVTLDEILNRYPKSAWAEDAAVKRRRLAGLLRHYRRAR